MRLLLHLMPLLLVAASAAGCPSKFPADSGPPPSVGKNLNRPDPEAARKRKLMLIDPRKGGAPSPADGKH